MRFDKFDDDTKTALSGANIWDQMEARGRAVRPGTLTVDRLMLNLQGQPPRSLAEMTALFWTNPRMPMLADPQELRNPLFAALETGQLELVNAEGAVITVPDRPADLPLNSPSISVRIPLTSSCPSDEVDQEGEETTDSVGDDVSHGNAPGGGGQEACGIDVVTRARLWLKFQTGLADEDLRQSVMALLSRLRTMTGDDLESCVVTLDLIGDEARLKEFVEMAKQVAGTQHRLEDLPD